MRGYLFSFFLIMCCAATAQNPRRYFFTQFTTREGLSNNSINDIIQDRSGFIWIATDDGLNRFDGHHFRIFRHQASDSGSLASNQVTPLCLDSAGRIWCGGRDWPGVSVFDPVKSTFTTILFPGVPTTLDVLDLFCDQNGMVWVSTSNGIYHTSENGSQLTDASAATDPLKRPLGNNSYHGDVFCRDPQNNGFWLSTKKGVNYYDGNTGIFYNKQNNPENRWIFKDRTNRPMVTDSSGILWLCERKKDYWAWAGYDVSTDSVIFRDEAVQLDNGRMQNNFFSLECSPGQKLWLGNNSRTPLIFDTRSKTFDYSLAQLYPGSLTNHSMRTTFFDREGNTWVGMEEGLYVAFDIYKQVQVGWIGAWDEFKTPRIKCLYQPDSTSMLIAANQEMYWWHSQSDSTEILPLVVNGKIIPEDTRYVARKNDHEVWVATFFGLYSFDLVTKQFKNETEDFPEDWKPGLLENSSIQFIQTAEDGTTILCCARGIYLFNRSTGYFRYIKKWKDSEMAMSLLSFSHRPGGRWWMADAVNRRILYFDDLHGELNEWKKPDSLLFIPNALFESQDGDLWLGSYSQGLVRVNLTTGKISTYQVENGLHSNCVFKILEDEHGRIWVVTSNGIARYNVDLDSFENLFSEFSLPLYVHRDVGQTGADHLLHFFSQNIFYSLDPSIDCSADRNKPVRITAIALSDSLSISMNDAGLDKIPFASNTISFEFSVLNFNPNSAVKYEYRLDGLHQSWRSSAGETHIRFNDLPAGDYVFKVRSDNGTGIFGDVVTEVPFVILPPWYSTWWFRLAAILLFIAAIGYVARFYAIRKVKKREAELEKIRLVEEERLRIARDMHDDLGGGLSSIRMMSDQAIKYPDSENLREISHLAGDLVERMRQIVWALNQEQNTVEDLCYYMVAWVRVFLRPSGMHAVIGPPIQSQMPLSARERRNIFLAVKEAVHNAVKHSGGSQLEIQFALEDDVLVITLRDDGRGMDPGGGNRLGNGLRNMRQRVEELGGSMEFLPGPGTILKFTFPIHHNKS